MRSYLEHTEYFEMFSTNDADVFVVVGMSFHVVVKLVGSGELCVANYARCWYENVLFITIVCRQ